MLIDTKDRETLLDYWWPSLRLPPLNLLNMPRLYWKKTMPLTDKDIRDKLMTLPEIDLLEVLEITSEDLVNRFHDRIEAKADYLEEDLE